MRINTTLTIVSGTPQSVAAALGLTGLAAYASRISLQMAKGGVGMGYVLDLDANPSQTPNKATAGQVAGQMAPADAAGPGGTWSDATSDQDGAGINLANLYVDGDNSGDTVIVSANRRV